MKNIISFSLWGNDSKYTEGAIHNIQIANLIKPKWKCRLYVHSSVPDAIVEELVEEGAQIINITEPISSGMLWRFRPLMDKSIDRFIVRDTDGRLTMREMNCILDWIASKKEFHIIRDNKMHGTRIMGGMWGATKEFINRIDYKSILESHDFKNTPNVCGYDQDFLAAKIYPLIKNNVCIHDDFHLFKDENVLKIPHIREKNDYIGEPWKI